LNVLSIGSQGVARRLSQQIIAEGNDTSKRYYLNSWSRNILLAWKSK
jgi:hypothetical protein